LIDNKLRFKNLWFSIGKGIGRDKIGQIN
jgi:hypothetical protein